MWCITFFFSSGAISNSIQYVCVCAFFWHIYSNFEIGCTMSFIGIIFKNNRSSIRKLCLVQIPIGSLSVVALTKSKSRYTAPFVLIGLYIGLIAPDQQHNVLFKFSAYKILLRCVMAVDTIKWCSHWMACSWTAIEEEKIVTHEVNDMSTIEHQQTTKSE